MGGLLSCGFYALLFGLMLEVLLGNCWDLPGVFILIPAYLLTLVT